MRNIHTPPLSAKLTPATAIEGGVPPNRSSFIYTYDRTVTPYFSMRAANIEDGPGDVNIGTTYASVSNPDGPNSWSFSLTESGTWLFQWSMFDQPTVPGSGFTFSTPSASLFVNPWIDTSTVGQIPTYGQMQGEYIVFANSGDSVSLYIQQASYMGTYEFDHSTFSLSLLSKGAVPPIPPAQTG